MAVTRRGYIFAAFLISVLCVVLIAISLSTNGWIIASAADPPIQESDALVYDSEVRYGLFTGDFMLSVLGASTLNTNLYMVCLLDLNACAVSCRTTPESRREEVRALANGLRTNAVCNNDTRVDGPPLERPAVISAAFYVSLVAIVLLQLIFAFVSAILAIVNAIRNPTEPVFGLPGVLWSNALAALFGAVVLLMWGIYWAVSHLSEHLAFNYIAVGALLHSPNLGYSYWLLILAILCSICNVVLVQVRSYLLEKDPPPPTITIENHSDGTIFLY